MIATIALLTLASMYENIIIVVFPYYYLFVIILLLLLVIVIFVRFLLKEENYPS